jgi:hypothetical protein
VHSRVGLLGARTCLNASHANNICPYD